MRNSNNNNGSNNTSFVQFLENHKKLLYIVILGIFIVLLLIVFVGSDTLKAMGSNISTNSQTDTTNTTINGTTTATSINTDKLEETTTDLNISETSYNLQTENTDTPYSISQIQPETISETVEEKHLLFYDTESFNFVLESNINKIKNSEKIDNYVCNYSKDEDSRLIEASEKEKLISSLDDINEVINIRETIYNNNHENPQLASLLGHSYLKKSDFELDNENKLIDLKKSREYFLKKIEFLDPEGDESGYVDVVVSSFRIINAEDNIHNDIDSFYNKYIEILSYSAIAQEINPKNNAANYYTAFIYHEFYKNTPKNNTQLRDFFKNKAIEHYELINVSSDYYIKSQKALDLLK